MDTAPSMPATWIDLLDATPEEVSARFGRAVDERILEWVTSPTDPTREARPRFESHGDYLVGQFVVATVVADENRAFFQEIGLLITHGVVLTLRKNPNSGSPVTNQPDPPFEPVGLRTACHEGHTLSAGLITYHLLDEIAEHYVEFVDTLHDEITEAELNVDSRPAEEVRKRLADLRLDVLHVRRILLPTRDAVNRVAENRLDTNGDELFTSDVESALRSVYEAILRCVDGLEAARELLASARDYLQAKVANDQNDVMKRLTVMASLLLLPTLVVGFYGQNFDDVAEFHWGIWWSWALIVVTTIGQLIFFQRKGWLGRRAEATRSRRRWGPQRFSPTAS